MLYHTVLHTNLLQSCCSCCVVLLIFVRRTIPVRGIVQATLTSDGCGGDVSFLEHVEAVVTMSASVRGQVMSVTVYINSSVGVCCDLVCAFIMLPAVRAGRASGL